MLGQIEASNASAPGRKDAPRVAQVSVVYRWDGEERRLTGSPKISSAVSASMYQSGEDTLVYVRVWDGPHMSALERPKDPRNFWLFGAICGALWTASAFVFRQRRR